jgi:hypothetical protein
MEFLDFNYILTKKTPVFGSMLLADLKKAMPSIVVLKILTKKKYAKNKKTRVFSCNFMKKAFCRTEKMREKKNQTNTRV